MIKEEILLEKVAEKKEVVSENGGKSKKPIKNIQQKQVDEREL